MMDRMELQLKRDSLLLHHYGILGFQISDDLDSTK